MSRYPRRRSGADPALLRRLYAKPAASIVDQPPTALERAFRASAVTMMIAVSAYLVFV